MSEKSISPVVQLKRSSAGPGAVPLCHPNSTPLLIPHALRSSSSHPSLPHPSLHTPLWAPHPSGRCGSPEHNGAALSGTPRAALWPLQFHRLTRLERDFCPGRPGMHTHPLIGYGRGNGQSNYITPLVGRGCWHSRYFSLYRLSTHTLTLATHTHTVSLCFSHSVSLFSHSLLVCQCLSVFFSNISLFISLFISDTQTHTPREL